MPEPERDLDITGKKIKAHNPELNAAALVQFEQRMDAVRGEHPGRTPSVRVGRDNMKGVMVDVHRCNICGAVLTPHPETKTWKHEPQTPKAR